MSSQSPEANSGESPLEMKQGESLLDEFERESLADIRRDIEPMSRLRDLAYLARLAEFEEVPASEAEAYRQRKAKDLNIVPLQESDPDYEWKMEEG